MIFTMAITLCLPKQEGRRKKLANPRFSWWAVGESNAETPD